MQSPSHVIIVAGPTASGKSALALAIARALDGVVINADSMQIYDVLDVVTARPGADDLAAAPHRLYGVLSPLEVCSAARFRAMALAEIATAHKAGKLPVICGGTGFWIDALLRGLSPVPEIDPGIREDVRARVAECGALAMHDALSRIDPAAAARIEPGDAQRIARALEVYEATGRTLSDWQNLPRDGPPAHLRFISLVMLPPRDWLYARCNRRFEAMLHKGAIEEVAALMALEPDPALPACKALGVPEIAAMLKGEMTRDQAIASAQQATRNFAKRQYTWFRGQMPGHRFNEIIENQSFEKNSAARHTADMHGCHVVNAQFSDKTADEIISFLRYIINTD